MICECGMPVIELKFKDNEDIILHNCRGFEAKK